MNGRNTIFRSRAKQCNFHACLFSKSSRRQMERKGPANAGLFYFAGVVFSTTELMGVIKSNNFDVYTGNVKIQYEPSVFLYSTD